MTPRQSKRTVVSYGQWVQPTLPGTFWCHWHEAASLRALTLGHEMNPCIFLNGHSILLKQDVRKIDGVARAVAGSAAAGRRYADLLERVGRAVEAEHLAVLGLPRGDADYLPRLFSTYANVVGLWWLTIPLGLALERRVRKMYPRVSDEDLFRITKPVRPTWLDQQSRAIERFAGQVRGMYPNTPARRVTLRLLQREKALRRAMEAHVEKFRWWGTHHWMGEAYTLRACLGEVRSSLERPVPGNAAHPHVTPVPAHLRRLLRVVSYWRTHCAELTSKVVFLSRPVLGRLATRWSLRYEDLTELSHREILEHLGERRLPQKLLAAIQARRGGYGCLLDRRGGEHICTGQELERIVRRLVETRVPKTRAVRGTVASRGGTVQGRAAVIMSPRDFGSFRAGDILVANETTPDFMPLMKRAAAVVTDVGGVTSHAAIVARELGLPCVVGTKIATKVFRSRDCLEVNTATGTVKKVS